MSTNQADLREGAKADFKASLKQTVELAVLLGRLQGLKACGMGEDGAINYAMLLLGDMLERSNRACLANKKDVDDLVTIASPALSGPVPEKLLSTGSSSSPAECPSAESKRLRITERQPPSSQDTYRSSA